MAYFGLIEPFEIDNNQLAGLTPQECFTLGVEWQMFRTRLERKEYGTFIIHTANAQRISNMCDRHAVFCEWHPTVDIWAEIIIGNAREKKAKCE